MGKYRQGLQFLLQALDNGLSGDVAYGILQDLQQQRRFNQERRASTTKSLMDLALGMSQSGYDTSAISDVVGQYASSMPGLGPRAEAEIASFASGLPPAPMGPGEDPASDATLLPDGTEMFDASDLDILNTRVTQLAEAKTMTLSQARQMLMNEFRAMKNANGQPLYNPTTIAYIFRAIASAWVAARGPDPEGVAGRVYGDTDRTDDPAGRNNGANGLGGALADFLDNFRGAF